VSEGSIAETEAAPAMAGAVADRGPAPEAGIGPWRTAWRKLRRDRAAMAALAVLVVIVAACLAARLYADHVAHTNPFESNLDGSFEMNGETISVMEQSTEGLGLGFTPIGPTWDVHHYFLGADAQGRDVAARLLYGGRNSLVIAGAATLICVALAAALGLAAGFFGGLVDTVLSRLLDVLWAFPVYLLAISLSIVLISKGIEIGPITIESGSLALPIFIIGIIYVPYLARPVRGQVLALRHSEFVLAAIGLGVPSHRILVRDILPNVSATLIVFVPLMMALNMLTESALSYLSIGVQPPDASWGTIIQDGQNVLYTRPMVAIAPGLAIVITVLALNVLGDGLRDALDPRTKRRLGSA
jgi:peptide/nickel transport system permease protein